MDAVAESFKKTHIVIWIAYAVCLTLFSIPLIFSIQNERAQRKLTAHRQQTKAQRRAWLDAHPEEKGAPPQRQTQKRPPLTQIPQKDEGPGRKMSQKNRENSAAPIGSGAVFRR